MNVLVVGNGLDLALGYPTSFNDCYNWLRNESNEGNIKYFNYVNDHYTFNKKLWADLENDMMYPKDPPKGTSNEEWYDSYLWHDMYQLFRRWVLYISHYVDNVRPHVSCKNMHEVKLIKKLVKSANFIITFNYTKTLEDYFNINSDRIIHIHNIGDNGQPILGHVEKTDSNQAKNNFLVASEKDTDGCFSRYKLRFEDLYISKINFLGVSYSKPDMSYYKFLNSYTHSFLNDCLFECYYHLPSDIHRINNFRSFLYKNNITKNLSDIHLHKDN